MTRAQVVRQLIAEASRTAVADALADVELGPNGAWLPVGHPFAVEGLSAAAKKGALVGRDSEFAAYHAASVFGHCGDAWAYFGHGLNAIARGDIETAAHMVYYCELRAAASLLASHGLAIGDRNQFALRTDGTVHHEKGAPTHEAMWDYLSAWGHTSRARDAVLRLIRPGVAALDSWLSPQFTGSTSTAVIGDLLTTVSLDLATLSDDRRLRNHASYTPSRILPADMPVPEATRIIATVLDCLEPSGPRTFPQVDIVVTRRLLLALYCAVAPATAAGDPDEGGETSSASSSTAALAVQGFTAWAASVVPKDAVGTELHKDLIQPPEASRFDHYLNFRTDTTTRRAPRERVEGMVARAVVLLRLATGSAAGLLSEANRSAADLDAWIEGMGLARGLWPSGDRPEDFLDLWADLSLAREDLQTAAPADTFSLVANLGERFASLAQAERVLTWSL
jgi:hypothetical protein